MAPELSVLHTQDTAVLISEWLMPTALQQDLQTVLLLKRPKSMPHTSSKPATLIHSWWLLYKLLLASMVILILMLKSGVVPTKANRVGLNSERVLNMLFLY